MFSRLRMFMLPGVTMTIPYRSRKRDSLLTLFALVSILLAKPCSTLVIQSLRPSVMVTGVTNLSALRLQELRGRNMSKVQRQQRGGMRRRLECLTKIPSGKDPYTTLRKQTAEATQTAINSGIKLIELEFPPVRGKLDISLSETLDANRAFARELARTFSAKMGQELWLVFPDDAEAALARKTYGGTTFRVVSIQSAIKDLKDDACQLQIVVNPGFNVDEWIVLDKLARPDVPMVMLNGGLDRLRGGYYPRIFYPGLYNATQRFLKNFETVYYLKAVPGGWIFRKAPEDWQARVVRIISFSQTGNKQGKQAAESKVLEFTADRPDYNRAVKVVQTAAQRAQEGG